MHAYLTRTVIVICLLSIGTGLTYAGPQMLPARTFALKNDTKSSLTVELQINNEWKPVNLSAGADTALTGDRIRVSTNRKEDGAVITVDIPVQPGKRYRVVRSDKSGLWDFSRVP